MMRQGRRRATILSCLVLVVTAMQGVTPDGRDMASPLALKILRAQGCEHHGLCDDDDNSDEVCEVEQDRPALEASQILELKQPCALGGATGSDPVFPLSHATGIPSNCRIGRAILFTLCRLVC